MESTWLTKTIYKRALEQGRVYMTANNHTRNGITEYNVYIENPTRDMKGIRPVFGWSNYWNDSKESYHIVAWGTSRPLEIILSIGYKLGLKFDQIKQNWKFL